MPLEGLSSKLFAFIGRDMNRFPEFFQPISLLPTLYVLVTSSLLSSETKGEESGENTRPRISHVSSLGFSGYRIGRWGAVSLSLINPTDEPVDLLAVTHFEGEPTLQYGRRIWTPPKSRRLVEQPIRLPETEPPSRNRADFRTALVDPQAPREVFLRGDAGALQSDGVLPVANDLLVTGLIDSPSSPATGLFDDAPENAESAYELLVAARLAAQQPTRISILHDKQLPSGEESLNALDQLVIANNQIVNDEMGLEAVRRWLFGGGRLWIMLDRVDPHVLEQLLGDEIVCEVVDRVSLTTVRVESSDGRQKTLQEFENPVDFVRLAISEVDVTHRVDGWPAAFRKTFGDGWLLVTTLAPRGWMRLRTAADSLETGSSQQSGRRRSADGASRPEPPKGSTGSELADNNATTSKFIALEPMATLAAEFLNAPPSALLPQAALEPLVQEYVGYSILPQWQAASLLCGFCALLAASAVWLWKLSRLELLALVGPGIALAVGAVLVLMGWQQRQVVRPSVATLQIVKPIPGTDDVRVEGAAGVFSPESGVASISSGGGGRFMPEMSGMQGTTRRMVWTDTEEWQWEHLPQTAGLRAATFRTSTTFAEPVEARATFGPQGLSGHLQLPSGHTVTDPIVATREGRLAVEMRDGGAFIVRSGGVFSAEQYLAAGLLSDEQNRRRRVLQSLLANPLRLDFPTEPTLLFWTDSWNVGFHFGEHRRSLGAALIATPVKLERPAGETEISIPSPFLPFERVVGPDESIPSPMWDAQHRRWIERSIPSTTWLRFQVPRVLLPIAIQRGAFQVQVRGPIGKLEIATFQQATGTIVPLKTWVDPVGSMTLRMTDSDIPKLSEDGGLLLRVSGGDPDRPELTQGTDGTASMSYWQIESLTLELSGKTINMAEPDARRATEGKVPRNEL